GGSFIAPVLSPKSYCGQQLDSTLIAHGSLGGRWPNVGDPTAEDLIERNGLTERNSGKDTDLGHYVVSVHIVRRVRFRVAPGLRPGRRRLPGPGPSRKGGRLRYRSASRAAHPGALQPARLESSSARECRT